MGADATAGRRVMEPRRGQVAYEPILNSPAAAERCAISTAVPGGRAPGNDKEWL